ncbi:MAG: YdcF family protein [Acidimicrobiales bacterium]
MSREARRAFRTVWAHLVVEHPVEPADAVFCFGSRLSSGAGAGLRSTPPAWRRSMLVTGGPAAAGAPESTVFARRLVELAVPTERIVEEPVARHTGENVELGLAVLRGRVDARRLVLVSWPLAARRAVATFARQHPEIEVRSAPALRAPGWRWCPTPRRIGLALGELDRLERYAALGWIAPVERTASVAEAVEVLRDEQARLAVAAAPGSAHDAASHRVPPAGAGPEAQEPALLVAEG